MLDTVQKSSYVKAQWDRAIFHKTSLFDTLSGFLLAESTSHSFFSLPFLYGKTLQKLKDSLFIHPILKNSNVRLTFFFKYLYKEKIIIFIIIKIKYLFYSMHIYLCNKLTFKFYETIFLQETYETIFLDKLQLCIISIVKSPE